MTNAELEAMCEQAFPPKMLMGVSELSELEYEPASIDENAPVRSKALALAMEVRDKTERETLRMVAKQLRSEQLTWPNKQRAENVNYDIAIEWVAKKLDEMARSLLSEAQK